MLAKVLTFLSPYALILKLIGVALVLLSLWYGGHQFTGHYIQIGVDKEKAIYDTYLASEKKLYDDSVIANNNLRKASDEKEAKIKATYDATIAALDINTKKLTQELQDALPYIAKYNAASELSKAGNNGAGKGALPPNEITAQQLAESGRDCNGTVAILTKAGKSCALAYDTLYDSWMAECDAVGGCLPNP